LLDERARPASGVLTLVYPVVLVCAVGVALGTIALSFSPQLVLVALAAGGLILAALKRPEIALLAILVAKSTIIFEDRMPLIPIGVGSLHVADVILLALFGLILLRWLAESDFHIVHTPLDLPLLAFYGVALLSTLIAVLTSSLEFNQGLRGIRDITFYLTFFLVINLVREQRQLTLLLRGFLALATAVAIAMIAQYLVGESLQLLPGRVETLSTQGESYGGVFRILPPGQSLTLVAFVVTTVALVLNGFRPLSLLRFLQWGLLGLVVVLTFNRSFWVVAGLALLLTACLLRGQDRQRLVVWSLVVALLASVILPLAMYEPESRASTLVRASIERLRTLVSSGTLGESSIEMRYVESEYARSQITKVPLIGLGIGARYRPWDSRIDWRLPDGSGFDGRAYIHNGHLWILLQSGLLGYLCFVWLSLAFLVRGLRYWRSVRDSDMRAMVLGFTVTYLGVMLGAIVNPMLMQSFWIPVLGVMLGMTELAVRRAAKEELAP
jgi:hypothetical protein